MKKNTKKKKIIRMQMKGASLSLDFKSETIVNSEEFD